MKDLYLIGYSGHAFVVADSAVNAGYTLKGYFETEEKKLDPFGLVYMGKESDFDFSALRKGGSCFTALGDNSLRKKIAETFGDSINWINVIDPTSVISGKALLETNIYIGKQAVVNPLAVIKKGSIVNTSAVVEHECLVGEYCHIAPMAVLCGNVEIGDRTFVGANSVIRQGIIVGSNVTIGAGSVVTKNIPDNAVVYGNPAKFISK